MCPVLPSTSVVSEMMAVEALAQFLVVLLREKEGQGQSLLFFRVSWFSKSGVRWVTAFWGRGRNRNSPVQVEGGLRFASALR